MMYSNDFYSYSEFYLTIILYLYLYITIEDVSAFIFKGFCIGNFYLISQSKNLTNLKIFPSYSYHFSLLCNHDIRSKIIVYEKQTKSIFKYLKEHFEYDFIGFFFIISTIYISTI